LHEEEDAQCQRVELNAMTSLRIVEYIEAAFANHGVDKGFRTRRC
jgi:hypothetical protein